MFDTGRYFVPILYPDRAFEAFGDFSDLCRISKLLNIKNLSSSWFESYLRSQISESRPDPAFSFSFL